MNKTIKTSHKVYGSVLLLTLVFFFFPSQSLDSEKGVNYKSENIINKSNNYFNAILSSSNLQRPFPKMVQRDDNPDTPEKIELGKMLFFDPVLSGDNTVSCAHCHHPDLGFSDNRGLSMGNNGKGVGPVSYTHLRAHET